MAVLIWVGPSWNQILQTRSNPFNISNKQQRHEISPSWPREEDEKNTYSTRTTHKTQYENDTKDAVRERHTRRSMRTTTRRGVNRLRTKKGRIAFLRTHDQLTTDCETKVEQWARRRLKSGRNEGWTVGETKMARRRMKSGPGSKNRVAGIKKFGWRGNISVYPLGATQFSFTDQAA